MRNTPLIQSIDPGIHFYDAERDIDTYIPIDKDGNWKFPERAPDVEIDGYKFFFKGYGAIELAYDQNHITALRTAIIKNVPFGSTLNINDYDLRTQFNLIKDPPHTTWGGIFAQYEAPAFQKFQFYSTNVVFWKQQEIDGELYNFYKIPCHRYHYLLAEPLSLEAPEDDYADKDPLFVLSGYSCKMKTLKNALDFDTFEEGEGPNNLDGVTKIENNMTVEHDTFVISQSNPLKQNLDLTGLRWIVHEADSYDAPNTPGLAGTIDNTDQLCVIACLHVSYDPFAKQSRS